MREPSCNSREYEKKRKRQNDDDKEAATRQCNNQCQSITSTHTQGLINIEMK